MTAWKYGMAKLRGITRDGVIVQCPHCPEQHLHSRLSLGSQEVVAGCHTGFTNCRSYAIPERRDRRAA